MDASSRYIRSNGVIFKSNDTEYDVYIKGTDRNIPGGATGYDIWCNGASSSEVYFPINSGQVLFKVDSITGLSTRASYTVSEMDGQLYAKLSSYGNPSGVYYVTDSPEGALAYNSASSGGGSNNNLFLYIGIAVGAVLVLGIAAFVIIRLKKK